MRQHELTILHAPDCEERLTLRQEWRNHYIDYALALSLYDTEYVYDISEDFEYQSERTVSDDSEI